MAHKSVDIAIIGAGTAGMSAYREAKKYTQKIAFIEGGEFGTTCARVGCMPSKLLIAPSELRHRTEKFEEFGLVGEMPKVDGKKLMRRVKFERDRFVGFTLESVDSFDQSHIFKAHAKFLDDHTLELSDGQKIKAKRIIIATGSSPFIPEQFKGAGDRIIISDDVFYWDDLPESVAVFGSGVIGLELCQAMHRLGVRTVLFGKEGGSIGPVTDPEIKEYARQTVCKELNYATDTNDMKIAKNGEMVEISYTNRDGKRIEHKFNYLLAAVGRKPNVDRLGLKNTSLELDDKGLPVYDKLSMRCGNSHIFIAGDANGDIPLLHEAADEGKIAGKNAGNFPNTKNYARRTPLGIVFSDPQIAIAGQLYRDLTQKGVDFKTGTVSFENQGRSRVMLVNRGMLNVYGEVGTGVLLGAEMIGPQAEHLAHLLAWQIQDRKTVAEVLHKPFYHPVVEEGLRTALRELLHNLGMGAEVPKQCIDCGPGG